MLRAAQVADAGADAGTDAGAIVCSLPFEAGPCDAAIPVYAYVNGACVARTYGGCQGNGNRFNTDRGVHGDVRGAAGSERLPRRPYRQGDLPRVRSGGRLLEITDRVRAPCDADAGAAACSMALPICSEGVCQYAFCH